MTKAYQLERASQITIYNYLGVLFAAFWGIILFSEVPQWQFYPGALLLLLGIYQAVRREKSRVR
jgi:drug/metabolite transporter (DMT)-like permease